MLKKPSQSAITFKKFLQRVKRFLQVEETALLERRFDVYRADTGAVLARGIDGYEAAKQHATRLNQSFQMGHVLVHSCLLRTTGLDKYCRRSSS